MPRPLLISPSLNPIDSFHIPPSRISRSPSSAFLCQSFQPRPHSSHTGGLGHEELAILKEVRLSLLTLLGKLCKLCLPIAQAPDLQEVQKPVLKVSAPSGTATSGSRSAAAKVPQQHGSPHLGAQTADLQSSSNSNITTSPESGNDSRSQHSAAASVGRADTIAKPDQTWPGHRHEAHLQRISEEPRVNLLGDILCASLQPATLAADQQGKEPSCSQTGPFSSSQLSFDIQDEANSRLDTSSLSTVAASAHSSVQLLSSKQPLPQTSHPSVEGHLRIPRLIKSRPSLSAARPGDRPLEASEASPHRSASALQDKSSVAAAISGTPRPAASTPPAQGLHSMQSVFQSCGLQDLQPACSDHGASSAIPAKPSSSDCRPPGMRYSGSNGNLKASMRPAALTTAGRSQSLTDSQAAVIQPKAEGSPTANPQQGVPVYVMLPLDTVRLSIQFQFQFQAGANLLRA